MGSPVVDLKLAYKRLSTNITPEGVTAHYGGPSPWRNFSKADHARCPSIVRAWHSYHLSKGWAGLAYSAIVCPHGTIYRGRWTGRRTAAQGTNPGNQRSYAVCYLAGDDDPLTDAAKRAFHDAARALGHDLRWNHADWKKTSCAGEPIRAWQRAGWPRPGSPPTPPTPPTPPIKKEWSDMATEAQIRKIIREEVERGSNRTIQFMTAVVNAASKRTTDDLTKRTRSMADETVRQATEYQRVGKLDVAKLGPVHSRADVPAEPACDSSPDPAGAAL